MSIAIESQVIVNWYPPEKKLPEEGIDVIVTISGKRPSKCGRVFEHDEYDHAFAIAQYWDEEGWVFDNVDGDLVFDEFTVHAWCDLEPFGGADA